MINTLNRSPQEPLAVSSSQITGSVGAKIFVLFSSIWFIANFCWRNNSGQNINLLNYLFVFFIMCSLCNGSRPLVTVGRWLQHLFYFTVVNGPAGHLCWSHSVLDRCQARFVLDDCGFWNTFWNPSLQWSQPCRVIYCRGETVPFVSANKSAECWIGTFFVFGNTQAWAH